MFERGKDYGSCDNCGVMVDLEFMTGHGLLNGLERADGNIEGETCWDGHTICHTWNCPVCEELNDTEIPVSD